MRLGTKERQWEPVSGSSIRRRDRESRDAAEAVHILA